MREIAPLLHKRATSSPAAPTSLSTTSGTATARSTKTSSPTPTATATSASLVVYNNRYDSTRGTIHISAAYMDKGSGSLRQRSLSEGLSLPMSGSAVIAYRDNHGLEYLRRATDIHWHGMSFDLHGFQCAVLLDWRELWPNADWPWDRLCDQLAGRGVSDVHEEMAMLRLRPLHDALREALSRSNILTLAEVAAEFAQSCAQPDQATESVTNTGNPSSPADRAALPDREVEESPHVSVANVDAWPPKMSRAQLDRLRVISDKSANLFAEITQRLPQDQKQDDHAGDRTTSASSTSSSTSSKPNPAADYVDSFRKLIALAARLPALVNSFSTAWPAASRPLLPAADPATNTERTWAPILAFLLLRALPERFGNTHLDIPALFDRLLLRRALADIFSALGLEGESRWQAAAQVCLLLTTAANGPNVIQSAALFHNPDARWLAGVHDSGGTTYFNREQFEELTTWLQLPALLDLASVTDESVRATSVAALETAIATAHATSRASGYRLADYLTRSVTSNPEIVTR